jgi:hypothetical protein
VKKKELVKGTKLFSIWYWGHNNRRTLETETIKKVNPKKVVCYSGYTIPKSDVGEKWFLTKKEAYAEAIKSNDAEAEPYNKEVRQLRNAMKRLKE